MTLICGPGTISGSYRSSDGRFSGPIALTNQAPTPNPPAPPNPPNPPSPPRQFADADFACNSTKGGFFNNGAGLHTGNSAHWSYRGITSSNGAIITCTGSTGSTPDSSGQLATKNPLNGA
jgi:hypothetical protein